jgi:hypothetical protein
LDAHAGKPHAIPDTNPVLTRTAGRGR